MNSNLSSRQCKVWTSFLVSDEGQAFKTDFHKLNALVKRANNAIISDSYTFSSKSIAPPVKYARSYKFEEDMLKACFPETSEGKLTGGK